MKKLKLDSIDFIHSLELDTIGRNEVRLGSLITQYL